MFEKEIYVHQFETGNNFSFGSYVKGEMKKRRIQYANKLVLFLFPHPFVLPLFLCLSLTLS